MWFVLEHVVCSLSGCCDVVTSFNICSIGMLSFLGPV